MALSVMAIALNSDFWTRFASQTWERKPLVVKDFKSPLRELDSAEVFSLLVRYADRCRKNKSAAGFKFYIDGQRLNETDVLQILPRKRDASLAGYHRRMSRLFSDYCLVCDELLSVNLEKQDILAGFTSDLYRHVGFPNRFSEMGLYLGNYRKTPFGVHVDGCGVFSFPVEGRKKFRTWTSAFVQKNPALARAFNYAKYKKHSRLLEAGPGDLTYWPSAAWHIAESNGSFSCTWSLGVWVDKRHRDVVAQTLTSLLAEKSGSDAQLTTTGFQLQAAEGEMQQLPELYSRSIALLRTLSGDELQDAFFKMWMTHVSKQGFKTLPKTKTVTGPRLRLRSVNSPILWRRSKQGTHLAMSFAGVFIEVKYSAGLLKIIKALNAGETCARKDLKCLRDFADAGAFI